MKEYRIELKSGGFFVGTASDIVRQMHATAFFGAGTDAEYIKRFARNMNHIDGVNIADGNAEEFINSLISNGLALGVIKE